MSLKLGLLATTGALVCSFKHAGFVSSRDESVKKVGWGGADGRNANRTHTSFER